jgi:hypothetical protein
MEAGNRPQRFVTEYLLAGLETGIIAVLVMLLWLGMSAIWYRKTFWTAPNLAASVFYGESALRNRFTSHTFSGLAFYLLIYGCLGILFGLLIQDRRRSLRITCLGILVALGWYFLLFGWIWKHWNPLIALYTHDRPMFAGHVVFGWMLGRYPRAARNLKRGDLQPEPTAEPPVPRQ